MFQTPPKFYFIKNEDLESLRIDVDGVGSAFPATSTGVVELIGDVDVNTCAGIRQAAYVGRSAGCVHMIFDLSQVRYIDSTALSVLWQMHMRQSLLGGRTSIVAESPMVLRMVAVAYLDRVTHICASVAEAVRLAA